MQWWLECPNISVQEQKSHRSSNSQIATNISYLYATPITKVICLAYYYCIIDFFPLYSYLLTLALLTMQRVDSACTKIKGLETSG